MPRCSSALIKQVAVVFIFAIGLCAPAAAQHFETRSNSPIGPPHDPVSIAVGDFNGDGKLDMAVTPYLISTQIAVLLGRGDGTFLPPAYYPVEEQPTSIATADLNGDHILDLVVGNSLSSSVTVLLGNGDGTFRSSGNFSLNGEPAFVAIGDFNNDGLPDLAVADSPYLSVLLGKGDGTFEAPMDVSFSPQFPTSVALGDFNHDGNLDAALTGLGGELNVLLGKGDGTFDPAVTYRVGLGMDFVVTADLNGDHNLDLIAVDTIGSSLYVLLGDGRGGFGSAVPYFVNFPTSVATADLSGDGKVDVVAGSNLLVTGGASILFGDGHGGFGAAVNYPVGKSSAWVATGDFNRDGKQDIAVADDTLSDAAVLLNTGVVSFAPTTPLKFPPQPVGTTSQAQTVTLSNKGSVALSIASASITGDFLFSTTCTRSLPPGDRCQIKVKFQPTKTGLRRGLVTVVDSASTQPQVIELFGEGQ